MQGQLQPGSSTHGAAAAAAAGVAGLHPSHRLRLLLLVVAPVARVDRPRPAAAVAGAQTDGTRMLRPVALTPAAAAAAAAPRQGLLLWRARKRQPAPRPLLRRRARKIGRRLRPHGMLLCRARRPRRPWRRMRMCPLGWRPSSSRCTLPWRTTTSLWLDACWPQPAGWLAATRRAGRPIASTAVSCPRCGACRALRGWAHVAVGRASHHLLSWARTRLM